MDEKLREARLSDHAWRTFRDAFEDGEFVVLEDDDGRFWYGKLTAYRQGIRLERQLLPTKNFDWRQVVFVAHDGFPVREVEKLSYEECEGLCDRTPTDVLRDSIQRCVEVGRKLRQPDPEASKSDPEAIARLRERRPSLPPTASTRPVGYGVGTGMMLGGGCPFLFGPCEVVDLQFPGNNGPRYWGVRDDEETLILRADDGATMHSFDLDHLFLFDGLDLPHRQVAAGEAG